MKSSEASYEDTLSALTGILSLQKKDLDAREEKLKKAEESFGVDRSAAYGDTSPSDVLHLNIGGTKTTVLRRTLTSVPGSMLSSKFSGRWDDSLEKDEDGNFFIDQEFSLFQPMLKYLRSKANGIEKYPMNSPQKVGQEEGNSMQDFYRMVDYYGMTNGIYPTNLTIHTGLEDSVEYIHRTKVNAKEWTTFQLSEDGHGHGRKVKSYEVTLGDDVKRIQIGWIHSTHSVNLNIADGNNAGVGDISYTYALDLTKSTFLINGTGNPIDRLEYKKGTIVRSENYGSDWYVDGETIFPSSKEKCKDLKGLCPLISIKGEMEITSIQLVD